MKIRTDFVTNSSSSSYCVSFSIKPYAKKKIILDMWPEGEDSSCDVTFPLKSSAEKLAKKIKKCKTIDDLCALLINEIDIESRLDDAFECIDDDIKSSSNEAILNKLDELSSNGLLEDWVQEEYESLSEGIKNEFKHFKEALLKLNNMDEIESITINEFYTGWGEFARDSFDEFLSNVLSDNDDLDWEDEETMREILEEKFEPEEIDLIIEQITDDFLCGLNANINTIINMKTNEITKTYDIEEN